MLHILAICDFNSPKGKAVNQRLTDLGVSYEIIPAVFPPLFRKPLIPEQIRLEEGLTCREDR